MKTSILKFLIPFIVVLLYSPNSNGQDYTEQQLDSLKQLATICDSTGLIAMQELYWYYNYNNETTLNGYYAQREIDCAKTRDNKYALIHAYERLMYHHRKSPGMDSILAIADQIFPLIENDTSFKGIRAKVTVLTYIGAGYYSTVDDGENAYAYYQQAIDLADQYNIYDLYLSGIVSLGNYYLYDQEYRKAADLGDEALSKIPDPNLAENKALFENIDMKELAFSKDNLTYQRASAILYDSTRDVAEQKKAYYIILDCMKSYTEVPIYMLEALNLVIETMSQHLPLDTMLAYGNQAMQIDKELGENYFRHNLYRHHSKNLIKAGRYQEAQRLLETAVVLAQKQTDWFYELKDSYDALTTVYLKLGATNKAQESIDLYKVYSDSTYKRKNENALETIETKYALSQKEAENLLITQEAAQLNQRLKLFALIGGLLFLSFGLALAFYFQQRKSAKRLSQLNETKDKIFAILGHDLKGPSLAFNSLTKKLSFLIKKNDVDRLLQLAPSFEERGAQLSRIINDVLNWALAENESFWNNPEKVTISTMVQQVVHDMEWNWSEKNISIDIDIPEEERILFDKNAFMIINRNLLHNAVKFSPTNSSIHVRYDKQKKKIEYVDKGKGMSKEVIKNILNEIPVESSAGTQSEKGTGIGLVTCLKLAKLNKGNLSFKKNNPTGTIAQLAFG